MEPALDASGWFAGPCLSLPHRYEAGASRPCRFRTGTRLPPPCGTHHGLPLGMSLPSPRRPPAPAAGKDDLAPLVPSGPRGLRLLPRLAARRLPRCRPPIRRPPGRAGLVGLPGRLHLALGRGHRVSRHRPVSRAKAGPPPGPHGLTLRCLVLPPRPARPDIRDTHDHGGGRAVPPHAFPGPGVEAVSGRAARRGTGPRLPDPGREARRREARRGEARRRRSGLPARRGARNLAHTRQGPRLPPRSGPAGGGNW